jgi:hypothetical protein
VAALASGTTTTKTWHYKLKNAILSWASSAAFILDGAKINLQVEKLALSAYPVESAGNEAWDVQQNLPRRPLKIILKDGLSILIRLLQMWQVMKAEWNIQVVFCGWESKGEDLWGVTDHEFGHNWFPMIVGSNERLFAWMDGIQYFH